MPVLTPSVGKTQCVLLVFVAIHFVTWTCQASNRLAEYLNLNNPVVTTYFLAYIVSPLEVCAINITIATTTITIAAIVCLAHYR